MEDFDAGDGLHGLPINRTDDTENTGKSDVIHKNNKKKTRCQKSKYHIKYQLSMSLCYADNLNYIV